MTRLVVLDTETTGFSPEGGDRIIEIGCVEILNSKVTDAFWHSHINPERYIPASATKIHGITDDMVQKKPTFEKIADEFLEFIGDATLVIHNAAFDMRFINHHLAMIKRNKLSMERVIDTLLIAKKKFLGSSATLNSLCRRFNIDLRGREYHGALIDARLLARVYIEMELGNQGNLFSNEIDGVKEINFNTECKLGKRNYAVRQPTEAELEANKQFLVRHKIMQ